MPSRKYCIVPKCKNTGVSAPNKLFFSVPKDAKIRKKWCRVMKRNDKISLSSQSGLYCCEDHFNVEEDTQNFIKYSIMKQQGIKVSLPLKKGVFPHIFECQKRNVAPPDKRIVAIKRKRLTLVNEALSEYAKKRCNESSQISDFKKTTSIHEDETKQEITTDEDELSIPFETTSTHEDEIKEEIKMDEDEIFIPSMQSPVTTELDPLERNEDQLNHVIGHNRTSLGGSSLNNKRYEYMARELQREKALNATNKKTIVKLNSVIKRLKSEIKMLKSKKS